ncbi:hypothetical protein ABPG74_012076 [Tetrahymena malaccensis]
MYQDSKLRHYKSLQIILSPPQYAYNKLQISFSTLNYGINNNCNNLRFAAQNIFDQNNNNQKFIKSNKDTLNQKIQKHSLQLQNGQSKQQLLQQIIFNENQKNKINAADIQNYSDQESEYDSDEEEFSIWEENDLQNIGINTDQFNDSRVKLQFYQIYRLRSALYQQSYVSRLETIQEVQMISSHFNQKISVNELKQQQIYLDTYYSLQKKDQERNSKKQSNNNILDQSLKKANVQIQKNINLCNEQNNQIKLAQSQKIQQQTNFQNGFNEKLLQQISNNPKNQTKLKEDNTQKSEFDLYRNSSKINSVQKIQEAISLDQQESKIFNQNSSNINEQSNNQKNQKSKGLLEKVMSIFSFLKLKKLEQNQNN